MEGCPGCESSRRYQSQQHESIIKKAAAYAKEHDTPVAIYQEQGEFRFIELVQAYAGSIAFTEIISQHYQNTGR